MKTKTWILIAAMAALPLFTAGAALAQDVAPGAHGRHGHGGHHGHGPRVEMLVAILGLDSVQEASIRQIIQANQPRREAIRQMTDEQARHAAMRALHEQTRASIDALLNPEQRATLERMHAVRREHGRGHGRGRGAPPSAPMGI